MNMNLRRECLECGQDYEVVARYAKRGQGYFCSRPCSQTYNARNRIKEKQPNAICAWCQKAIYKTSSQLARSKSGLSFCGIEHKNLASRVHGGIPAVQPAHYGKESLHSYRERALRHYGKACQNCAWDDVETLLEVNHRDCNRENNAIENLEVLCPTCHRLFHWLTGTGAWKSHSGLTNLTYANKLWYRPLAS